MEGRFINIALAVMPYVGFGAFIQYCNQTKTINWDDDITITPLMRKALHVHFWYFITVPIMIEVFPDTIPGLNFLVGTLPPMSTNGFHMIQCLAAENFFVTAASLGFLLRSQNNNYVPRWTFMTPFAQLAWNLKNHLSWFFIPLAPEGRMPFALIDIVLIWPITTIYVRTFFSPAANQQKKDS